MQSNELEIVIFLHSTNNMYNNILMMKPTDVL